MVVAKVAVMFTFWLDFVMFHFLMFLHVSYLPTIWFFLCCSFLYSLNAVPGDYSVFERATLETVDHIELITKTATTKGNYLYLFKEEEDCWARQENMAQHGTIVQLLVCCIHCRIFFYYYFLSLLSLSLSTWVRLLLGRLAYSILLINILSSEKRERTRGGRAVRIRKIQK